MTEEELYLLQFSSRQMAESRTCTTIMPHAALTDYAESRIMPKHAPRQQAELFLGEMIRHKLAPIRRSEYRADRD